MARRGKGRSGKYVSRGGDKLERAIVGFSYDPTDVTAVDLGANVGGFTDCLLQHGAGRVYAVDTGYGVLEWKLRQDERVVTMERVNALHVELPEKVGLIVADVGWTSVLKYVPTALGLLRPGGVCIALLKPQYEVSKDRLRDGHVDPEMTQSVVDDVVSELSKQQIEVAGTIDPDLESRGRNPERFLMINRPAQAGD